MAELLHRCPRHAAITWRVNKDLGSGDARYCYVRNQVVNLDCKIPSKKLFKYTCREKTRNIHINYKKVRTYLLLYLLVPVIIRGLHALTLTCLIFTKIPWRAAFIHFAQGETNRGEVTWPKTHAWCVTEPGLKPWVCFWRLLTYANSILPSIILAFFSTWWDYKGCLFLFL